MTYDSMALFRSIAINKRKVFMLVGIVLFAWAGIVGPLPASETEPVSLAGSEGFKPRLGTYLYVAKWGQAKAFEATLTVQKIDNIYRILVDSRTTGVIDFIFKLRYRGEGHLSADDLAPLKTVTVERQRKKSKQTQISYLDDGGIEVVETRKKKKKKKPETKTRSVNPEKQVLEPFSAAFIARKFNWEVGETQQFEVFTGKREYLVTLFCQEKTIVEESGTKTAAWVIRPAVKNLSQPEKKSKITKTKIYISADANKDLLKLKSETKAGTVVLKMKKFIPQKSEL